jgi:hypothetical protein
MADSTPSDPALGAPRPHFRRFRSPVPIKHLRFEGPNPTTLCRRIEAHAQIKGLRMNDFLLSLLEKGLSAEVGRDDQSTEAQ